MSIDGLPAAAAVLGSGGVGRTLAAGLQSHGITTTLGTSRAGDPEVVAWAADAGVPLASFADAAVAADVVLLVVPGAESAVTSAIAAAGDLDGKILIDVTNPLVYGDGGPQLEVTGEDSGGERLQRLVPGAKVVKAFNTVGNGLMIDPELTGGPPVMFIAGDDEAAKAATGAILEALGWRWLDVGGIERSRELEQLCVLWVAIGAKHGHWDHAFTLLRP